MVCLYHVYENPFSQPTGNAWDEVLLYTNTQFTGILSSLLFILLFYLFYLSFYSLSRPGPCSSTPISRPSTCKCRRPPMAISSFNHRHRHWHWRSQQLEKQQRRQPAQQFPSFPSWTRPNSGSAHPKAAMPQCQCHLHLQWSVNRRQLVRPFLRLSDGHSARSPGIRSATELSLNPFLSTSGTRRRLLP
jgi:hypothetical protein